MYKILMVIVWDRMRAVSAGGLSVTADRSLPLHDGCTSFIGGLVFDCSLCMVCSMSENSPSPEAECAATETCGLALWVVVIVTTHYLMYLCRRQLYVFLCRLVLNIE